MADGMDGSAPSEKRAAMLLLLDGDSSESESSSTDTSDSSDTDSDAKACAYEREFNKLFRIAREEAQSRRFHRGRRSEVLGPRGTRVLIENAFSTLKKRFRQLMYLELHTIHWLNKFIISCCILHNLCIDYGDEETDDDNDDDGAPNAIQWENCTDNHSDKTDEERALHKLGEI
ncbi:hypothetical protein HPB51_002311 [Rhipicephalus microplus]|uniref:DDE Tnp4 domain-containing protein n=1 Tax=Rhipicephalus microplus TaxID=6941 RepID=A0A9J6DRU3_RHIMP|nr:hypothetical protein HPB51_002311 [Rhipicephalus microplus]